MRCIALGAFMRRREFLTVLGGAAAWPGVARAQAHPIVGFLGTGTTVSQGQWAAAFIKRLEALGWINGRTASIEVRWADGHADRADALAIEYARRKVDVIVTSGTAVIDESNHRNTNRVCISRRPYR
jgi:putative ABC transport system substrate-binding protein